MSEQPRTGLTGRQSKQQRTGSAGRQSKRQRTGSAGRQSKRQRTGSAGRHNKRDMEAAIADLYRDHGARTLRLAYLLTGDLAVAEDLVQDAFVRVLGRVRSIRDPHALNAYLSRTVVNLAKNHHRASSRAAAHANGLAQPAREVTLPDLEGRDELHRELLQLPHRQRAALVMRYCDDLPEAEVATLLGTSPKAVRSLVGRGLATLRHSNGGNADE